MNSHLPRPEKSRLLTVAMVAIAVKITPVPPKASMISDGPFEKPSTKLRMRDSIRPMKNVKPSSTNTPTALSLVFWIANMKPKAIAKNASMLIAGLVAANSEKPVARPTHAPSTVGIMDSASSQ